MKKLLLLTVIALATAAAMAPAASADVEVRGSDNELCGYVWPSTTSNCEFELEGRINVYDGPPPFGSVAWNCGFSATVEVDEFGGGLLYANFHPTPGDFGLCWGVEACDPYGWPLQIVAAGEGGHQGLAPFEAMSYGCYTDTTLMSLDGEGFEFQIAIEDSQWQWSVPRQSHTAGYEMEISGMTQDGTVQITDVDYE